MKFLRHPHCLVNLVIVRVERMNSASQAADESEVLAMKRIYLRVIQDVDVRSRIVPE
jgi:hypothetical protein